MYEDSGRPKTHFFAHYPLGTDTDMGVLWIIDVRVTAWAKEVTMFLASLRTPVAALKLAGLTLLAVLAIGMTASARADVFDVTTTDDDIGSCDPGDCSLREAIDDSNANSGTDTINVPAGEYDTSFYGELIIDREGGTLLIKGAGANTTKVNVLQEDRVLKIKNAEVTIEDITFTGGGEKWGGGGIANYSSATTILTNVAVTDNYAGFDLSCKSAANVVCSVEGDGKGGGIFNSGYLTINESEISNNTALGDPICGAGLGGGIYNKGILLITNDTVSGNEADNSGIECDDSGLGGGIFTETPFSEPGINGGKLFSVIFMLNVTLAGNTAGLGGGIASDYPNISPQTNEFPGGVLSENTIVADNTANDQPLDANTNVTSDTDNCYLFEAQMFSFGNNLESDTSCAFTEPGDIQNGNAGLGALANNGGPTNTMALQDGSQALDSANNEDCPATDQRGVTRPQNVICDIGAYEKEPTPPTPPAPPAAVAPATAQAKPVAKSSISGPSSCTRGSATVRVSGQNIASVTYSLDGKRIKKASGNKTSVRVNLKNKKSGIHRVSAKVSYTAATAAASQTKRFTVSRCARAAAKPKFTG
jgi:CSLREA domain-containing protein